MKIYLVVILFCCSCGVAFGAVDSERYKEAFTDAAKSACCAVTNATKESAVKRWTRRAKKVGAKAVFPVRHPLKFGKWCETSGANGLLGFLGGAAQVGTLVVNSTRGL